MSDHDLLVKMQKYLPVETRTCIAELTAERALKQRQFEAVLAERAALRLQVAALAAERDFVQGKLVSARATSAKWQSAYIAARYECHWRISFDLAPGRWVSFEVSAVTDDGAEE